MPASRAKQRTFFLRGQPLPPVPCRRPLLPCLRSPRVLRARYRYSGLLMFAFRNGAEYLAWCRHETCVKQSSWPLDSSRRHHLTFFSEKCHFPSLAFPGSRQMDFLLSVPCVHKIPPFFRSTRLCQRQLRYGTCSLIHSMGSRTTNPVCSLLLMKLCR